MTTKVQQWGNSLGLRIPKEIAEKLEISPGTTVTLKEENGNVIISPSKKEKTLEEMCSLITDTNKHSKVWNNSDPIGKEVW